MNYSRSKALIFNCVSLPALSGCGREDSPASESEKPTFKNPIYDANLPDPHRAARPGHPAIVEEDDGDTWMAYHAWPPHVIGSSIPGRTLRMDELTWKNGEPPVDEQTLKRARIRALEEGTSVNAVLRDYLESYAGVRRERREAWRRIQELARSSGMSSGGRGLPKREELYDRKVLRDRTDQ